MWLVHGLSVDCKCFCMPFVCGLHAIYNVVCVCFVCGCSMSVASMWFVCGLYMVCVVCM